MYSDKSTEKNSRIRLLILLILAIVLAAAFLLSASSGHKLLDNGRDAVREAVEKSARQCYAVEGAYPPNLSYLQDNYGLQVNTEDYVISYEIYASNVPPTVKVVLK